LQSLNDKSFSGCSVARSSRLVWDEEVAGSNPATPTKKLNIFINIQLSLFYNKCLVMRFLLYETLKT
jgi:hypothetical protein